MDDIKKLKQNKLKEVLKKRQNGFRIVVDDDDICLFRDESKCIRCGKCKDVCKNKVGIYGSYDLKKQNSKHICIGCGKCVSECPTGALLEKSQYREVLTALEDYEKILVVSVAPAVRVSLAEEFGFAPGYFDEGKMITALRMLGFDYVFDITSSADITIMEEANELVERILRKTKPLPMFTSCCPAWVKYMEIYYPEMLDNLSSTKSPISIQGALVKTYFARQKHFKAENIIHVVVAPCTAKKFEIKREEFSSANDFNYLTNQKDVDFLITTKELAHLIKRQNIPFGNLKQGEFDKVFSRGSGGGMIFGASGGVLESVLREVYWILTGEKPIKKLLNFDKIRGMNGVKEDEISICGGKLKIACVNGIANAKELIEKIKTKQLDYDFVEVMACPGGCVGGGGQPKNKTSSTENLFAKRAESLYNKDAELLVRCPHNNPDIKEIYSKFLEKPLSEVSKSLLHTKYHSRKEQYFNNSFSTSKKNKKSV